MSKLTVFISYAREDISSATRIYEKLKQVGLEPWFDMENLGAGQRWKPAIRKAIRKSRFFLALFSSRSVNRRGFVHKELTEALDVLDEYPESDVFLIPVRLDDCQSSHEKLSELHRVDMFPSWEKGMEKLLKALEVENTCKQITDKSSILFTIGYLFAKARWFATTEIISCSKESNIGVLLDTLECEGKQWYPQQCLDKITMLVSVLGWEWNAYIDKLNSLLGTKALRQWLLDLRDVTPCSNRSCMIEDLINQLAEEDELLFHHAGETGAELEEVEIIFIGHQVGKIDQTILMADKFYSINEVMPTCRIFLEALFEPITTSKIQTVLSEFPGIESRAGTIGQQELRSFISRMKHVFLQDT